jgi:hypothetical protein
MFFFLGGGRRNEVVAWVKKTQIAFAEIAVREIDR